MAVSSLTPMGDTRQKICLVLGKTPELACWNTVVRQVDSASHVFPFDMDFLPGAVSTVGRCAVSKIGAATRDCNERQPGEQYRCLQTFYCADSIT
jgi:hypothetical protein